MKHVEYDDSYNKQDVSHGGEKVSSPFGECQKKEKRDHKKAHKAQKNLSEKQDAIFCLSKNHCVPFVPYCGSTMAEGFGPHSFEMMRIDVVTLDHAIESLAIDG